MLHASTGPGPDELRFALIVVYDPADGRIVGTALHGSYLDEDSEGISRSVTRLLETVAQRSCEPALQVETLVLPLSELGNTGVDRVDPLTKSIVTVDRRANGPFGCS